MGRKRLNLDDEHVRPHEPVYEEIWDEDNVHDLQAMVAEAEKERLAESASQDS